jgi:hypothetical protein
MRGLMKKALLGLGCLAGVGVASVAHAAPQYSFDTVDSYEMRGSRITVTGVLQGQSAPATHTIALNSSTYAPSCERMLAMSIARPGRYRVGIDPGDSCTITRR